MTAAEMDWMLDKADIEEFSAFEVYVREGLHTFTVCVEVSTLVATDKKHLQICHEQLAIADDLGLSKSRAQS